MSLLVDIQLLVSSHPSVASGVTTMVADTAMLWGLWSDGYATTVSGAMSLDCETTDLTLLVASQERL